MIQLAAMLAGLGLFAALFFLVTRRDGQPRFAEARSRRARLPRHAGMSVRTDEGDASR